MVRDGGYDILIQHDPAERKKGIRLHLDTAFAKK